MRDGSGGRRRRRGRAATEHVISIMRASTGMHTARPSHTRRAPHCGTGCARPQASIAMVRPPRALPGPPCDTRSVQISGGDGIRTHDLFDATERHSGTQRHSGPGSARAGRGPARALCVPPMRKATTFPARSGGSGGLQRAPLGSGVQNSEIAAMVWSECAQVRKVPGRIQEHERAVAHGVVHEPTNGDGRDDVVITAQDQ